MKLNRIITKTSSESIIEEPVQISASESISLVWDLTKEVFSLTKKHDVESRLQRNVINIIRRKS